MSDVLAPGVRLGSYEIVSILGAGGMGQVYRARDTRLERTVAIKLLPEEFRDRTDRRQRLQTEARLISALNHPHICALYDVGEQNDVAYLVMEHLEGETLAERIANGPLTADEVLRWATEIADALDHAHRAHIVHRDLKPANVMLTSSGAKLLDFGLARGPAAAASLPGSTLSLPAKTLTAEGTIVGTFHYMAPEQLEGKPVDARTDIFAFGALLFEMATGRKAFEGESQASLIASILTGRPPAISTMRPADGGRALPASLDHIVERCLARNPDERWQSARDIKLELEWIATRSSTEPLHTRPSASRRSMQALLVTAAIVAAVIAAGLGASMLRPPPGDVVRLTLPLPPGGALARGPTTTRVAVSPDGRHVAFVTTAAGLDRLWVQSLDSLMPRPLADGAVSPFWSPDSRFIGFVASGEGQIKRVSLSGGPARSICEAAVIDTPVWLKDGTILFAQYERGISRVPADGGAATSLTHLDKTRREINHMWPAPLPDGRHFLYTVTNLGADGKRAPRAAYVHSLDTPSQTLLTHAESRLMYSPPGYLLYVDQGVLLAQPFDAGRLRLNGEPVKLAEELAYYRSTGNADFSVSDNGVLVYHGGTTLSDLVWFDRAGRQTESGWNRQPFGNGMRLSPDASRVIAEVGDPRLGTSDIWTFDLARRVATRFTADVFDETGPTWSPDARRVVFSSDAGGANDLLVKATDGLGGDEPVLSQTGPQVANDWSADGTFIVFEENNPKTGLDLWLLPLAGNGTAQPLIRTRFQEWGARLSPDAASIAFVSNESGTSEIYVAPLHGSGEKMRISTGGGIAPRWRRDGKELFYVATDTDEVVAVPIAAAPGLTPGRPVRLFPIRRDGGSNRRLREVAYDVAADGQRFLVKISPAVQPAGGITVVLNWSTELRR